MPSSSPSSTRPAASPACSPPSRAPSSWARPSSRPATPSTAWAPRPSRPLSTSAKQGVPGPHSLSCPRCGGDARCKGYRWRDAVTLLGAVRLRRHYYHCPRCRAGTCPRDALLGLAAHDLTPAAGGAVCPAGVLASFAEAAGKALPRLAGLRLAEPTAERATEPAGRRLAEALAAGATFGGPQGWAWHRDAEGKTVAYVLGDSTGVGRQGPGGAEAEGRMANVAATANRAPEGRARWADPSRREAPPWQARYLAALRPWSELGEALRRQGCQVGMGRAERWVAICDGANGLAEFLEKNFPRVEAVILDFRHAAEYLGKVAQALHPGDEAAAEAWRGRWCRRPKHEGGAAVLAGLRGLEVRGRAARECLRDVVTYFTNQAARMGYPAYRAKGWHIGSGVVESACKRVVGQRLKGGGMRWGEDGADALCHLRALFLSDKSQWGAFRRHN
jgi:hypothetical protein